ncbi:alcohol dehydrogenase catalytic domain-containing protein [Candidatus Woesearchaeota archaeon]|nr:alcohol dehydrogenase catalytic domain-containing protein [Candidatus Woesearchaeota archaeon]
MKVAVYYNNKDVRIEERPVPEINDDELLVKVMASGICGTDVLEWYRIKKAPLVLGHEISGIIDKAGKNVKNFKVGDRVVVSHHVPCMKCHYCMRGHHTACETLRKTNFDPGGFSEYLRVPKLNAELGTFKLPETLSFEEGAFIEPLGTVLRAQRLANLKESDSLLVIGSGVSGLLHVKAAKARGIKKIMAVDVNEYRLNAAKRFGADFVFNGNENIQSKLKDVNENRLADIVIVCTGALTAAKQALNSVDRGGTILFFAVPRPDEGLEIPINDFWRNEVKIMTSYGAAPNDLKESLDVIAHKKINLKDMVTHKLKFDEIQKGFQLVAEAKESLKVIIYPNMTYFDSLKIGQLF